MEEFIKTRPFAGKRITGKILNKLSLVPLVTLKKSTAGYFLYRKYIDTKIVNEINDLKSRNEEERNYFHGLLDNKVYEMMKLTDALKSELMAEINKDVSPLGVSEEIETQIVNKDRVTKLKKLNLGSGSHIMEDHINVDHRAIKGVDLVADIRHLPFKENTIEEILLSHVFEHFTELQSKEMIRYWFSLLEPGGMIKIIVPDIASMALGFGRGDVSWDRLRKVVLGGQDYNSDYHFNMFSEEYLGGFLSSSVNEAKVEIVAVGRANGEALELEAHVIKPKKG
jgi:hypothetical protein